MVSTWVLDIFFEKSIICMKVSRSRFSSWSFSCSLLPIFMTYSMRLSSSLLAQITSKDFDFGPALPMLLINSSTYTAAGSTFSVLMIYGALASSSPRSSSFSAMTMCFYCSIASILGLGMNLRDWRCDRVTGGTQPARFGRACCICDGSSMCTGISGISRLLMNSMSALALPVLCTFRCLCLAPGTTSKA